MTKRVLIIDDEQGIRETTQVCLEITGDWEVFTASSGKEGLALAASQQPDIILLDVMMPDMDGLTTLKRIQSDSEIQHIPVVFLTAKAQPSEQRQFSQLKLAALITKPYDPFTLSDQLTNIISAKRNDL
ncbi:two-component response regulator [Calothrix sp. NIES-4071]|nr:two-component response regulator [Calothrix sp. NIES-4071]BAZ56733.1 two-component response regulator [Calothrix sp. NIES-4105]